MTELSTNEIQARLDELEQRREARSAAAKANTLEQRQRELELAEALDKAETEIGPVGTHLAVIDTETPLGSVIMKRPGKARYRAYMSKKSKQPDEDLEAILRTCIVYPDANRIDDMLDQLPGLLVRLGNVMAKLAGWRQDELTSK